MSVASWAPTTSTADGAGGGTTGGSSSAPTMDFGMLSTGVVDFANNRSATDMRFLSVPQLGTIEVRSFGSMVYEKFPRKVHSQMPSYNKPWLKIDQNALYKKSYGASLSQMQSNTQNGSANQLEYLKGVGGPVEKVGQQKVRGVLTTHYRATVDLDKAADDQSRKVKQAYGKIQDRLGVGKVPTEVWIDHDKRIRRLKMTFPSPDTPKPSGGLTSTGAGTNRSGRMVLTEDYYDFGVPANVERPPADQTIDFTQMASKMTAPQDRSHH